MYNKLETRPSRSLSACVQLYSVALPPAFGRSFASLPHVLKNYRQALIGVIVPLSFPQFSEADNGFVFVPFPSPALRRLLELEPIVFFQAWAELGDRKSVATYLYHKHVGT